MLKIWGRLSSINVKKVVWAAQELGLPFERTDAGGPFGVVGTPAYQRLNPNALVPVIDDDGFVLWESNAIVRYLCARHGGGEHVDGAHALSRGSALYPLDLPTRFDAERWMDWQQTTFNPAGRDAFVQIIRTPAERRDLARVRASVVATEKLLQILELLVGTSRALQPNLFNMGHIPVGCELHRWWGLPHGDAALGLGEGALEGTHPRARYPKLDAWFQQLQARPGARGVLDQPLS